MVIYNYKKGVYNYMLPVIRKRVLKFFPGHTAKIRDMSFWGAGRRGHMVTLPPQPQPNFYLILFGSIDAR